MTSGVPVTLSLFGPPYTDRRPITLDWTPSTVPPRGLALVWSLQDAERQKEEYDWLAARPKGLPLFAILPRPDHIGPALPLLQRLEPLKPRSVVPSGDMVQPRNLKQLLAVGPRPLGSTIATYLLERGVPMSSATRACVIKIFEFAPTTPSISILARRLFTSRRTIGRRFAREGLPAPSHWLGFARLMNVASKLQQDESVTMFRVACRTGYPDGFTMSNHMKRLLGHRPSEIRRWLGWEWLVEQWLRHEIQTGAFSGLE